MSSREFSAIQGVHYYWVYYSNYKTHNTIKMPFSQTLSWSKYSKHTKQHFQCEKIWRKGFIKCVVFHAFPFAYPTYLFMYPKSWNRGNKFKLSRTSYFHASSREFLVIRLMEKPTGIYEIYKYTYTLYIYFGVSEKVLANFQKIQTILFMCGLSCFFFQQDFLFSRE